MYKELYNSDLQRISLYENAEQIHKELPATATHLADNCDVWSPSIVDGDQRIYILLPNFIEWGLSEYLSLFLASLIPFLGLFTASLAAYRIEGGPWTQSAFRGRFRLGRPTKNDMIWTAALILFTVVSYFLICRYQR